MIRASSVEKKLRHLASVRLIDMYATGDSLIAASASY